MKIVVWHGYLLSGTGSNIYTRALVREWGRAGHEVVVVCQEPHPELHDLGGARVLRPELADRLLPVFVLDRYAGLQPKLLQETTDAERRRYVEARGWTATEFVDSGVSGAEDRRPALDALVKDAKRRRFDSPRFPLSSHSRPARRFVGRQLYDQTGGAPVQSYPIGTVCRTLTEAYARFGISITNPRSAWSAKADDGRVVVTLWSSQFADLERRVYSNMEAPVGPWMSLPANRRRTEHLKYARLHAAGVFDSIIITEPADGSERITGPGHAARGRRHARRPPSWPLKRVQPEHVFKKFVSKP